MRVALSWALAVCVLSAAGAAYPASLHRVDTLRLEWRDDARSRTVPVKVYYPADATGACPVIVFSHGLGGSRDGYSYLGECWASNGYISVHPQHPKSDASVWQGKARPLDAMRDAVKDPIENVNRPKDITFVLDRLAAANREPGQPLAGRIDMGRVGVGGHSYGAYTALAVSGRVFGRGVRPIDLRDRRVRACVALSAPARGTPEDRASYAEFRAPCLRMTGTEDASPITDTTPEQRRVPFDSISAPGQFLIILKGGDHMVFAGAPRRRPERPTDRRFEEIIRRVTLAFWDAYLRDDADARRWLAGGGLTSLAGSDAAVETK